ncbi:hypothetical protein BaRGS_00010237 [Batillaria attramentaria]|uniref:Uncharacterized protein n=1 Tax=Batillaria attramentaria TaxID=370345 RepID=A0ABD0LGV9_9CAEN
MLLLLPQMKQEQTRDSGGKRESNDKINTVSDCIKSPAWGGTDAVQQLSHKETRLYPPPSNPRVVSPSSELPRSFL